MPLARSPRWITRRIALAFLLCILATLHLVHGQQTSCAFSNTTCLNGGVIESCQNSVACSSSTWNQTDGCTCPKGYFGVECQFPTAAICQEQGKLMDFSFSNQDVKKPLECFIDQTSDSESFDLRYHRLKVEMNPKEGKVVLQGNSRMESGGGQCSGSVAALICEMSDCKFSKATGEWETEVSCGKQACRSEAPITSLFQTVAMLLSANTAPAVIRIKAPPSQELGMDEESPFTAAEFTSLVTFPLKCRTSMCVDAPPTEYAVASAGAGAKVVTGILAAFVAAGILTVIGCNMYVNGGWGAVPFVKRRRSSVFQETDFGKSFMVPAAGAAVSAGHQNGNHEDTLAESGSKMDDIESGVKVVSVAVDEPRSGKDEKSPLSPRSFYGPSFHSEDAPSMPSDDISEPPQYLYPQKQTQVPSSPVLEPPGFVHEHARRRSVTFDKAGMAPIPLAPSASLESLTSVRPGSVRCGLVFHNIIYQVKPSASSRRVRRVLNRISGLVEPGETLAIIGPSGSGKSSLLDILAGKPKSGQVEGTIQITQQLQRPDENGAPLRSSGASMDNVYAPALSPDDERDSSSKRNLLVGYVLQDDLLIGTETVYETLLFSAYLRIAPPLTPAQYQERIHETLRQLRIMHIRNSFIGDGDRNPEQGVISKMLGLSASGGGGISGGERKRVSIGVELVVGPNVLFLDEPTSGLDSHSAAGVVNVLHNVARGGCACIFSIHQVPASLFNRFDKVLVLTRLGRTAYFGPPSRVPEYLESIGRPLPGNISAPEYLIELSQSPTSGACDALAQEFLESKDNEMLQEQIRATLGISDDLPEQPEPPARLRSDSAESKEDAPLSPTGRDRSSSAAAKPYHKREPSRLDGNKLKNDLKYNTAISPEPARPWHQQLVQIFARRYRALARASGRKALSSTMLHFLISVAVALLVGGIFYQVSNDISGIQNRVGMLYFVIIYYSLTAISATPVFLSRQIFTREIFAGYYSATPYWLAEMLADILPLRIMPPLAFGMILYWLVGLQDDAGALVAFLGVLLLAHLVATSFCLAVSALSPNTQQANFVAVLYFIFCLVFGGLLIGADPSENPGTVVRYLSFFYYAFQSLMVTEFSGLTLNFHPKGFISTTISGDVILDNYGLKNDKQSRDVGLLVVFLVIFLLVGFLAVYLSVPTRGRSTKRTKSRHSFRHKPVDGRTAEPERLEMAVV